MERQSESETGRCGPSSGYALAVVLWWLFAATDFFGLIGLTTLAAEGPSLENKVKAGCLFNFAVNTEWPAESFSGLDAPLVIGLLGEVPFGAVLERGVQGKTAQGRKIEVRAITPEDAAQCHIVFVGTPEVTHLESFATALLTNSVLLVGEAEGFAQRGGIINFVKVEGSVKFEVNPAAAARSRLKLGSQMLKLAMVVKEGGAPKKD